jgi:hypothetical protein
MKRLVAIVLLSPCLAHAQSGACETLTQVALPGAKILSAQTIPAGAFPVPANVPAFIPNSAALYKAMPAICRVTVKGQPSADSDIAIEVWMPTTAWNSRFQGQGNGGFAGYIDYPAMAVAVARGYATAATDTGHSTQDAAWALGHPEKIVDYGYRAIHQMTEVARTLTAAFYGKNPKYSYFESCSNGGRQALMEAQRFPDDYDGILAGAPANNWTHLLSGGLWDAQVTTNDPASYIPAGKIPAIAAAVNAGCDAQDGVKDGIVNDPRACRFDPAVLLCHGTDSPSCLTAPQTVALKKLYEGAHDSTGRIFPGLLPGAEDGPEGWALWIAGSAPGRALLFNFSNGFFADMVYDKPEWNYKTADLTAAVRAADSKQAQTLNATDANLEGFHARGGKLIVYHGWNDPAISALSSIDYYESVKKQMGAEKTDSFMRLYMVPGMQHCDGGPGATSFGQDPASPAYDAEHNIRTTLERWVENGIAPATVVASKHSSTPGNVNMTRPLCPYPQSAKYKGSGDFNKAESFVCAVPNP